jgi:hypothetical protein
LCTWILSTKDESHKHFPFSKFFEQCPDKLRDAGLFETPACTWHSHEPYKTLSIRLLAKRLESCAQTTTETKRTRTTKRQLAVVPVDDEAKEERWQEATTTRATTPISDCTLVQVIDNAESQTVQIEAVTDIETVQIEAITDEETVQVEAVTNRETVQVEAVTDIETVQVEAVTEKETVQVEAVTDMTDL